MKTLTYGEIPDDLTIDEPYSMWLVKRDETIVCEIINQGIDSHLEAVFADDHGIKDGKHHISIRDSKSMRCFLRRCMESGNEDAETLASDIMQTLNIEWV